MTQGVLSFQYEEEKLGSGATSLSGLPVYVDFAHVAGLRNQYADMCECGKVLRDGRMSS